MSNFKPVMWECMWERQVDKDEVVYFANGDNHPHHYLHRVCIENKPPYHFVQAQVYQDKPAKETDGWFQVAQCNSAEEAHTLALSLVKALEGKAHDKLCPNVAPETVWVLLMNQIEDKEEDLEDEDLDNNLNDLSRSEEVSTDVQKNILMIYQTKEQAVEMALTIIQQNFSKCPLDHAMQNILRRQLNDNGEACDADGRLFQVLERPLYYHQK